MGARINLNALRIFEAAARHGSLTRAAAELGVTQSAVSKQVTALEAHLGHPLFEREGRRIALTPRGRELALVAADGLGRLEAGLRDLRMAAPRQITLHGDADFLQLWLAPRLARFAAAHPRILLSLHARIGMNAPPEEPFDLAVAWGRGGWACPAERLLENAVFPVCAPAYLAGMGVCATLGDVPDADVIHDQTRLWWQALRRAAGLPPADASAGRLYNTSALTLAAASLGDGVTVGDTVTAGRHLRDGRLVRAFGLSLPAHDSYWILRPPARPSVPEVEAVVAWLRAEASDSGADA